MLFSSILFLFYFIPIFFALYYATRGSNVVLLLGSVVFYAWGELHYLWLLALVTFITGIGGAAISRAHRRGRHGRVPLALAIGAELLLLGWFKYADFAASQLAALRLGWPTPQAAHWALPLGISFYTFHAISYLMDIHRRAVPRPARPVALCVYIAMFPQLVAGPIVRYATIAAQLEARRMSLTDIAAGIRLFVIGLAQKVLIANTLAVPVDQIFAQDPRSLGAGAAWLGTAGYTLQLYFDFGGYSLMAIGLGRMMGLTLPRNFDYPYVSRSITEFWRRWHISLSSWFRDYVYIPLGGNQRGKRRTYVNLWSVFLLCGLWHGAAWTFVLWGVYHGAFLALERAGMGRVIERMWRPLQHAYALLTIVFGWVLFRADTPAHAWRFAGAMLGAGTMSTAPPAHDLTASVASAFVLAIAASVPWARVVAPPAFAPPAFAVSATALRSVMAASAFAALAGLLVLSAAVLATGTYNPFIYFRF